MKAIGFFGTAKNTGKTTTVVSLTNNSLLNQHKIGITSIGYDGEDYDNITQLPKPKYFLPPGVVIATAEKTLKNSCLDYQVLKTSNINSALGKILILKIKKPGYYILAGPTSTSNLQIVLQEYEKLGIDYVFVDGALNRIAPFAILDGLVMATGAARTTNVTTLVQETKAICSLFKMPAINCNMPDTITLEAKKGQEVLSLKSLLTEDDGTFILKKICSTHPTRLFVPGMITLPLLQLLNKQAREPLEIIFTDVTKLLLAGDIKKVSELLQESRKTIKAKVCRHIKLLGITVNPYYPNYRHNLGDYKAAYIDKDRLLSKLAQAIDLPVVDMMHNDGIALYEIIEKELGGLQN